LSSAKQRPYNMIIFFQHKKLLRGRKKKSEEQEEMFLPSLINVRN